MRRSVLKLLEDIRVAADSIQEYTQDTDEAGYLGNKPIRRAVEREFEIIGEALKRMSADFPDIVDRITAASQIISFRNVLAHGYDAVEDSIVWSIIEKRLPTLLTEIQTLATEEQSHP